MKLRVYLSLFLLGSITAGASAFFQSAPGYMDADYYLMGGLRLAEGFGFTEPILWNYLDEPNGIPHPSHGYWMPLASMLAAAGTWLTGNPSFATGRLVFLLLAALVPPLTAGLSFSLSGRRSYALLAGVLAALPSFYLPFLTTTDTFGLYMVLGGIFLLAVGSSPTGVWSGRLGRRALLMGLLAGLMHLARADGVLWLVVGWLAVYLMERSRTAPAGRPAPVARVILLAAVVTAGYLLVMGPWLARNLAAFGSPLAPGGARTLWLVDYDELFAYPPDALTPERWWRQGLGELLGTRLQALGTNLGSTLAVQGQIYLLPLILLGAWRCRSRLRVQVGLAAWFLTFLGMTALFPLPGSRGGFFHSGAAVQTLFWALTPPGLAALIDWGARRRGWRPAQAWPVFSVGLILFALALTWTSVRGRVAGGAFRDPAWNHSARDYRRVEEALVSMGADPDEIVMVNNPPGYYLVSRRPAIVIPNGDVETLLTAGTRYGARYVILEPNHPADLEALYQATGDVRGLELLHTVGETRIFRLDERAEGRKRPSAPRTAWGLAGGRW